MNNGSYLTVPNFEKWQHYKDRCPPWIKLHRDVLNDYKFGCLQDASKAHLMAIWLLASQMDNQIPYDAEWIGKRINATQLVDINSLIEHGFLEIVNTASKPIAICKQSDVVETETETETEAEIDMSEWLSDTNTSMGKNPVPDDAIKVAQYLADSILSHDPGYRYLTNGKREKTVSEWSQDIEKIHRLDKREWGQIWKVTRWCLEDSFWRTNILSGRKLRKQFDSLLIKMPSNKSTTICNDGFGGTRKRLQ